MRLDCGYVRPVNAHLVEETCINELKSKLSEWNNEELIEYIMYLKKCRAVTREDRLKLQILDQLDFTIWACDDNFKIKLWDGACEKVYGKSREEALEKNYLETFVQPVEQHQSKTDALEIIRDGIIQGCRYCEDEDIRGFPIQIITQCCRVIDDPAGGEQDGEALQAEMALNINYEKLRRESDEFVAVQEREIKDIEQARAEYLDALETCKRRILESADQRSSKFFELGINGETYPHALKAVRKIVKIRTDFAREYQKHLGYLKTSQCFCDTSGSDCSINQYTFELGHSFNCIFRHNRGYLIDWRNRLELHEVDVQSELACVVLEDSI